MQLYISQLINEDKILEYTNKYNVGLELIDFSIAGVLDNPDKNIIHYSTSDYSNINFGVHGPFFDLIPATFDSLIKEVTLKRFNQAYKIAKKINAKYIIFHTGYLKNVYFYESWLQNSILFWNEFLKDKDDSIQIYIENVFEDEYKYLKQLVMEINKPFFNICLDLGHANIRNKYPLEEWIINLKDYIKHFHIHNNDGIDDLHNNINTGTIDYNNIFKLIKDNNIDADITLEINKEVALEESIKYFNK